MPELSVPSGIVSTDAIIEIDGRARGELSAGLLVLIIEETTEGLYRCEARFGNWGSASNGVDYLYFDRELLDFGKPLRIRMGAGDDTAVLFNGRISALEAQFASGGAPSLVVLAEDRGQALRTKRRTRVFEDMSDADAFSQIAGDHGLQPDIDAPGPTHKVLAQVNQSDLAFIRERCRWLDAEVWLDDRTLHIQKRASRARDDDFELQFGRGLIEFSVTADTANQYTGVVVSGWDVGAKETIEHEAGESALGSELDGDDSAASIVESAFGARVDRLAHHNPLTSAEAQALAEATFRAQARRFVVGRGLARGDARLRVGAKVNISGIGSLFGGVYYVCEARHMVSRGAGGGYLTEFTVERAGIGA